MLSAVVFSGPAEVSLVAALLAAAGLGVAFALSGRAPWPLSLRRALLFFLLTSLLGLGAALLPAAAREAARPGILVAALILGLVGLAEFLQFLLFDLALAAWLRRPAPPRILRDLATLTLALAAFLVLLRGTLGVNLSSLLATSAMISVVLALALQDTLGGFFAGLALQMEAPLAGGDWVRIAEVEGRVTQVGWRSVRVVTLDGDEVTVPNTLVARSTLINYSRPATAHRSFVPVRVPYRHPPREVLAALGEAMRDVPGVLASPPAHALLWEYGESEILYRARFWIDDYSRVNDIRGEIGARIWYRLRRAGIEHAFPARLLKPDEPSPPREELERRAAMALRRVDLFDPLTEAERAALASRLRPQLFAAGETVIRQGERGESMYLITRGRVEVRVASEGAESVVSTLGEGSFFGEMSLLTGDLRAATVVALADAELVPVAREDFRHVVAANPSVLGEIARIVAARRSRLAESIRAGAEAAAAGAAAHRDLLDRFRAFFGV